uniref:Uncharacterized protein n=1 Tax=Plectus sambesii TaxID=2011161 RepID=A0A914UMA5_9BILA
MVGRQPQPSSVFCRVPTNYERRRLLSPVCRGARNRMRSVRLEGHFHTKTERTGASAQMDVGRRQLMWPKEATKVDSADDFTRMNNSASFERETDLHYQPRVPVTLRHKEGADFSAVAD